MSKIPSRCLLNASSLLFALTFALVAARADDQPRGMPISGKQIRQVAGMIPAARSSMSN